MRPANPNPITPARMLSAMNAFSQNSFGIAIRSGRGVSFSNHWYTLAPRIEFMESKLASAIIRREGRNMARPYWSGQLQISLVSFGIQLFPAVSSANEISFRQIDRRTGERVHHLKVVDGDDPVNK